MAANAPDIDVLSFARGEYFALAFRRGMTHGLLAHCLLPFAVAGAMLAWDRWVRRRRRPDAPHALPGQVLLLAFAGVATHPAMDWMNVYGMRWLLPFSGTWSYGDALFIIDPWLWLVLGGALFLARSGGIAAWTVIGLLTTFLMVAGPAPRAASVAWGLGLAALVALRWRGWPERGAPSARVARAALVLSVAYGGLMATAGLAGRREAMAAARATGLDVVDVLVSPAPANPFVADLEVRTLDGYVPGTLAWTRRPRVALRPGETVPLLRAPADADAATVDRVLEASRARPRARDYLVWSRYPYAVVARDGGGWTVRWSDARYDGRGGTGGLAGVTVAVP